MSKIRNCTPVVSSLLDRLVDEDPMAQSDAGSSFSQQMAAIKDNIRRDLESLLNTRLLNGIDVARFPELEKSVLNYGLPDFSHFPVESEDGVTRFSEYIRSCIERFEPRFRQLDVGVERDGEGIRRSLYVKISAILMVEPEPVPVIFDSRVRHIDKSLKLRELRHG